MFTNKGGQQLAGDSKG